MKKVTKKSRRFDNLIFSSQACPAWLDKNSGSHQIAVCDRTIPDVN